MHREILEFLILLKNSLAKKPSPKNETSIESKFLNRCLIIFPDRLNTLIQ